MNDPRSQVARRVAEFLARHRERIQLSQGEDRVDVCDELLEILRDAAAILADGDEVAVVSAQHELTTQQAADLLNVSRPYVVTLLDQGRIPSHRVGNRRKVRLDDVLAYRDERSQLRQDVLGQLAREAQIAGAYDAEI